MKKIVSHLLYMPRLPILFLIKLYQNTISPDHGLFKIRFPNGFCRFYPSCSEYGYQIIRKNGLVVGIYKTMVRILRCNPWGKGGIDLP